jgi:hypothetical protein
MPRASTTDLGFCLRQAERCRRKAQEQTDFSLKAELLIYASELEEMARQLAVKGYCPHSSQRGGSS